MMTPEIKTAHLLIISNFTLKTSRPMKIFKTLGVKGVGAPWRKIE
jgi:hypothetical protein